MEEKIKELMEASHGAKSCAHAPYSHFRVGAALLTTEGKVFTGVSATVDRVEGGEGRSPIDTYTIHRVAVSLLLLYIWRLPGRFTSPPRGLSLPVIHVYMQ